jgi:hypothetical protein
MIYILNNNENNLKDNIADDLENENKSDTYSITSHESIDESILKLIYEKNLQKINNDSDSKLLEESVALEILYKNTLNVSLQNSLTSNKSKTNLQNKKKKFIPVQNFLISNLINTKTENCINDKVFVIKKEKFNPEVNNLRKFNPRLPPFNKK